MSKMDKIHWALIGGVVLLAGVIVAAGTEMLGVDGFINKLFSWGSYKEVDPAGEGGEG